MITSNSVYNLVNEILRYLAPEYFMHGIVDEKTDVFAFGVLLLEIISGRKPVDSSHRSLINWVGDFDFSDECVFVISFL